MDNFAQEYKEKILKHPNFPRTPKGSDGKFFIPESELVVIGEHIQTAYLKGDFINSRGDRMYYYFYIDKERNLGTPHKDNLIIGTKFYDRPVKSVLKSNEAPIEEVASVV